MHSVRQIKSLGKINLEDIDRQEGEQKRLSGQDKTDRDTEVVGQ